MATTRAIQFLVVIISLSLGSPNLADQARITINGDQPGIKVSPLLYGIFFEDINCSADGGIYAELVRNRSFEDSNRPEHWLWVGSTSNQGEMAVDTSQPVGPKNPRSLKVTQTKLSGGWGGVVNHGYWGMNLVKGEVYNLTLLARGGQGFSGPLTVCLRNRTGKPLAKGTIDGLTNAWKFYRLTLRPEGSDTRGDLVIGASKPGTFWLDMVSLFPQKTWKGRPNGLRPDLAEMLHGLKPGFVRFPGGCWVEGDTMKYAYRWKNTIGDPAGRSTVYNLWQYQATNGLGYHEYLQMCEDLGAEPLFVINCGMSHREVIPMSRMGEFVQDALDAIEYANGPVTSKWGAVRAINGHPGPFHLKYLEIGNENGGPAYQERWTLFYDAIKKGYPEIQLIADEPVHQRPADIVDEHYYNSPGFFISNAAKYDNYDRKGPKIYVGEYAVTQGCGQGNLRGALGEAAFMIGMERNSDVVVMSSYAPLFTNVHYKKWNPDLINFDSAVVYGTPSYYVQQMFSQNRPDVILPVQVEASTTTPAPVNRGAIGVGTWVTQAEYKDIKVTRGDRVLFKADLGQGTRPWKRHGGRWQVKEGALQQTDNQPDRRAVIGDPNWTDYTLSLKARKLGGQEGFLILFRVQDEANWIWWNLGGWGNVRHALERCDQGNKSILGQAVTGRIETGRWYEIRIDVQGPRIRCFLDNKLIHEATYTPIVVRSLYAVAGRVQTTGEVVVKVVNVSNQPQEVHLQLQGLTEIQARAPGWVLTGHPEGENSIQQPTRLVPTKCELAKVASTFRQTFPAHSLTVFRVKAKP